ncbi:MAG: tyrosine-type recombinase/integrase, partial [Hyphomicrobium sp.]
RNDALDFRSWWLDRVRDEHYDQGSANKDLGYIASMMRTVDMAWRLDLSLPFNGIRIAGEKHNARVAYEPEFVRTRILPGHELGALNAEARAVVRIVAATGMRPSEVVALKPSRIVIEADVPYVEIRPDDRQLKTDHSERDMPLVGLALAVMKEFREGFPRYRSSPDSFSATANKALGAAGLRPTPDHTVYSLRHTFKDRLIALEVPERIQDELMGHAIREIKYGAGSGLRQRADWLAKVWG